MKRTSIGAWQKCSKSFHLSQENASKRPSVSANRKDSADSLVRQGKPTCSIGTNLKFALTLAVPGVFRVATRHLDETELWRALGEFRIWPKVLDQSSSIVLNSAPGTLE